MILVMVMFIPRLLSALEIDTSYYYTKEYIKKMKGPTISNPGKNASLEEIILYFDYCCYRGTTIKYWTEWQEQLQGLTVKSKYMFGSAEKVEYTKRYFINLDVTEAATFYKGYVNGIIILIINKDAGINDNKINNAYYPGTDGETIEGLTDLTDSIWGTVITIVQALAVGSVIFAGLRYMYASAEKKADIKKSMMYLVIGALFVFATSSVMRFIFSIGNSLL